MSLSMHLAKHLRDAYHGGNYYRNLQGITEHVHYHLGQIVLIKRILLERDE